MDTDHCAFLQPCSFSYIASGLSVVADFRDRIGITLRMGSCVGVPHFDWDSEGIASLSGSKGE